MSSSIRGGVAIAEDPGIGAGSAIFSTGGEGHTIEKASPFGAEYSLLAGSRSASGYQDGPGESSLFDSPSDLCVHGTDAFVIDWGNNNLIRKVDLLTKRVSTLAGRRGVREMRDGLRDEGSFGFRSGMVGSHSIAVIGDSLYVLDCMSAAGPFSLRKVNINNGHVTTVTSPRFEDYVLPRNLAAQGSTLYFLQGEGNTSSIDAADRFAGRNPDLPNRWDSTIRLKDIDGDGLDDAIVLFNPSANWVSYYRALGDGLFSYVSQTSFGRSHRVVEVSDIDGDGKQDLIATFSDGVRTFSGNGAGGFAEDPIQHIESQTNLVWSQLLDLNRDGRLDVATLDIFGRLAVFLASADRRWGRGSGDSGEDFSTLLTSVANPAWFEISDWNGDRHVDVLTRSLTVSEVEIHQGLPLKTASR